MVDTLKLKGKIVERGTSIKELAKEFGISAYQFGRKINNLAEMSLREAEFLQQKLNIPDKEFGLFYLQ